MKIPEIKVKVFSQEHLASRAYFYAGGHYAGEPGKSFRTGQMFVEVFVPKEIRHPYPLLFIHGAGQSNLNWMSTPDGREGWADWFLKAGYVVYLAEQPARGRSPYHPEVDGPRRYHTVEDIEGRFAGTSGRWLGAGLHTQWPEEASKMGQPLFDEFADAQLEFIPDQVYVQTRVLEAMGSVLEKTGPVILVTHSQSGPFGWLVGDRYPELVKGIVALEPQGPAFAQKADAEKAINYGLAAIPLQYDPPVGSPDDFVLERISSDYPGELDGLVMAEGHIHKLPRLSQVPVLLMVAEASYHIMSDYVTAKILEQAGVKVDFVRLADIGFHGNSHFIMLEKNNLEIAAWIKNWLETHAEGVE